MKDLEKPVLNIEGEELKYCPNGKLKTYNYSANDNIDGDITSKVKVELKDNNIIFSVDDSSGNSTIAKKKAVPNDNESPKLTLNGNQYITIYKDTFYKDQGATAVDDCDGDLTSSINVSGNVDVSKAGTYVIKYSVKDSSNNMSTIERKVTVKDTEAPKIILNEDTNMYKCPSKEVGTLIAKRAQDKKIKTVVFDRGGYLYHGIIKELAEAAREAGLEF